MIVARTFAAIALALVLAFHGGSVPTAAAGERIERQIEVDGWTRSYTLFLPDEPSSRNRWPLIVAFHPAFAQGIFMERVAALHAGPGGGNFAVAYPDGIRRAWNAGDCCGMPYRRGIDDVAFYRAVVADVGQLLPLEPDVYLTGFSNGARMVFHIMCVAPQNVAAAATVGATRDMETCASSRIPLLHIHGADDKGSPALGGRVPGRLGDQVGYISPAPEVAEDVARRNGCSAAAGSIAKARTLGTTCTTYCAGRAGEVLLCIIPDTGHVWPGAAAGPAFLGRSRPDLAATEEILRFFNRH